MADWIQALAVEWGISGVLEVITTDSASNMTGMMKTRTFPSHYMHGQCGNHLIQRVIENEIFSTEGVKAVVDSVRTIVKFSNQSNAFCYELEMLQKAENEDCRPLMLLQDVPTRWNSSYTMLNRFVKLKSVVLLLLAKPQWANKVKAKIREEDWDLMAGIVSVLQVTLTCSLWLL